MASKKRPQTSQKTENHYSKIKNKNKKFWISTVNILAMVQPIANPWLLLWPKNSYLDTSPAKKKKAFFQEPIHHLNPTQASSSLVHPQSNLDTWSSTSFFDKSSWKCEAFIHFSSVDENSPAPDPKKRV